VDFANSLKGEISVTSIHTLFTNIRYFLLFANRYQLLQRLDKSGFRLALEEFVEYLRVTVRQGGIGNNTAQRYQYDAVRFLKNGLEFENIESGMRLIKKDKSSVQHTEAPCEDTQAKTLGIAQGILNAVSHAIETEAPFPVAIKVPTYLGRKDNIAWYLPLQVWTRVKNVKGAYNKSYDYETGEIVGLTTARKEGKALTGGQRAAKKHMEECSKYDNNMWLRFADLGVKAFAILFAANTGMNKQPLLDLRWHDDEYETEKESQGFVTIKHRAGDKEVRFTIMSKFLKTFEKYIRMRKKIVDTFGATDGLLVSFTKGGRIPKLASPNIFNSAYTQVRAVDPGLPKITMMNWRAAKAEYVLSRTDIHTASEILQNDPDTVKQNYSNGSKQKSEYEMGGFFEKLGQKVLITLPANKNVVQVASGKCKDFGNPNSDIENSFVISPDCRKSEGCLMCDKFMVVADEQGVRKLISCQFCIESTSHFSADAGHFESLYGDVLSRINELLTYIKEAVPHGDDLVQKIKQEVYEQGMLDPYWELKYEQLLELGVV
jgi:integrase